MKNNITTFIFFSLVSHLIVGLWWITQPDYKVPLESSNEFSVHLAANSSKNITKQPIRKTETNKGSTVQGLLYKEGVSAKGQER